MKSDATITLRKATPKDAADLAILDDLAGNGLPSWLWQGAVKAGEADLAYDFGRSRMASDDIYAWKSSWLAETQTRIAGKMTGYILEQDADLTSDIPVLEPIFELMQQAIGSWYLDALAVYPEFRGKGVGKMLLERAIQLAGQTDADQISLITSSHNKTAQALYRSHGFEQMNSLPVIGYDGKAKRTEMHDLMVRSL